MTTSIIRRSGSVRTLLASAGVLACASAASADIVTSGPLLTITATSSLGTGSISIPQVAGLPDGSGGFFWALFGPPVNIVDGDGDIIASLVSGSTVTQAVLGGGLVSLSFQVTAGNADTTFDIVTSLVSFDTINAPLGTTSAQTGMTDANPTSFAGGSSTGLRPGGKFFGAEYNGLAPGGTTFANLLQGPISVGTAGSTGISDEFPVDINPDAVYAPIGVPVSSISAQFNLRVSRGDRATGSGVFVVIPSPGSAALIGVAGVLAAARRRR